MMTPPDYSSPKGPQRRWINLRVVLLLAALLAFICGAVLLVNHLSKRPRNMPDKVLQETRPSTTHSGGDATVPLSTDKEATP